MWLGTFHGIAARLLRLFGTAIGIRKEFVIYDDDDSRRLMARVLADMKVPEKTFPVRQVLSMIDRAKNQGTSADQYPAGDYFDEVVGKAYRLYEERLSAASAVDFGGLLLSALKLCKADCPAAPALAQLFDHVLVDEFQDTNNVQYRFVRFLSHRTRSITVVGDEDQSIYRWRGADIRNILDFENDHPGAGVVKLEQNYRSTSNILRTANAVIARNKERRPKRLVTEQSAGAPVIVFEGDSEREEAEFVAGTIEERSGQGLRASRLRRVLPHPRPVARARRSPARAQHPLRHRRRHALLRSRRGQGSPVLPARLDEPRGRHRASAHHQRARARDRQHHRRSPDRRDQRPAGQPERAP
jgi:DNA helicase-2/ATP-dependent DNA helicase PcrA